MNDLVKLEVSYEYAPKVYVYKRTKGWYWKYQLPNGVWFYGNAGKTEKISRRNASRKEMDLARGLFTTKEMEKFQASSDKYLTFFDAAKIYLQNLEAEGASPKYYKDLGVQLRSVASTMEKEFKLVYVQKLTEEVAYDFRQFLLRRVNNDEISRVYAYRILKDVKRFFKWLKRRKKIQMNPWNDVEGIPVSKEDRIRNVVPPNDIIPTLLSTDYKHKYDFPIKEYLYCLFRTGARKEELLFMETTDVDWETGVWTIRPKECPNKHGMKWSPKNAKTRVTILPTDVLERLKPFVQRAKAHKVVGYTPNEKGKMVAVKANFIFTMKDRKLSKTTKVVYRRVDCIRASWGALFVTAGLVQPKVVKNSSTVLYKNGEKRRTAVKVPYTIHDMRRAFNIWAKEAGISIDDRALILGHSRQVNEDHYLGKPALELDRLAQILNSHEWNESQCA